MSRQVDQAAELAFGFFHTKKANRNKNIHESVLFDANYHWVIKNKLEHNDVLDGQVAQGRAIFLIAKSRVKFHRISRAWFGRRIQNLFGDVRGQRQLIVRAQGKYRITANQEGGTEFAEGHLCLPPDLAIRLLNKGLIRFYDKDGSRVSRKSIISTLQQTEVEFYKGKCTATVRVATKDPNAPLIKEWFEAEWSEYADRMAACRVVDWGDLYTRGQEQAGLILRENEGDKMNLDSDESDSSTDEDETQEEEDAENEVTRDEIEKEKNEKGKTEKDKNEQYETEANRPEVQDVDQAQNGVEMTDIVPEE